ncbi:seryl-tRNA synthetase [Auriculariales sp. MPI-PUGE-AT-0066]|nr:seryl-tRNA synthetase [Auriculariales sp. MPI-PUGE-AT-0066]
MSSNPLSARICGNALNLPPPRPDSRGIADNVVWKSHNAFNRKASMPVGAIQTIERLYKQSRELDSELNIARSEHNALIKRDLEHHASTVDTDLQRHALLVPNDTHPDVPIGPESAATVLATKGPEPMPADPRRDHVAVGRALGLLDLDSGAMSTGSSWYYLTNEGALLEHALVSYALDAAICEGLHLADIAARCGFQPRDPSADSPASQMYHLAAPSEDLDTRGDASLPRKVVAMGKAFRAEAGARGADTRGLIVCTSSQKLNFLCDALLEEMRNLQETLFDGITCHNRVLDMPTEELGAAAYRKYDIEAWMPGRGKWGEISSASNCTDYLEKPRSQPYAHTLNGTATAVPRLIVAC